MLDPSFPHTLTPKRTVFKYPVFKPITECSDLEIQQLHKEAFGRNDSFLGRCHFASAHFLGQLEPVLLSSPLCQEQAMPLTTPATGRIFIILFWARPMNLSAYVKGKKRKKKKCARTTCFHDLVVLKCYFEKLFFWAREGKRGLPWRGQLSP